LAEGFLPGRLQKYSLEVHAFTERTIGHREPLTEGKLTYNLGCFPLSNQKGGEPWREIPSGKKGGTFGGICRGPSCIRCNTRGPPSDTLTGRGVCVCRVWRRKKKGGRLKISPKGVNTRKGDHTVCIVVREKGIKSESQ